MSTVKLVFDISSYIYKLYTIARQLRVSPSNILEIQGAVCHNLRQQINSFIFSDLFLFSKFVKSSSKVETFKNVLLVFKAPAQEKNLLSS